MTNGLTKREYFAGLAMQAMASEVFEYQAPAVIVDNAVLLADAMIERLNQR